MEDVVVGDGEDWGGVDGGTLRLSSYVPDMVVLFRRLAFKREKRKRENSHFEKKNGHKK